MSHATPVIRQMHPWRVVAVGIAVLMLAVSLVGRAEAAVVVTFVLNTNTVSANTDASLDILLENDLNPGDTITVTFPAGWGIQDGALTTGGAAIDVSGFTMPPASVEGDSGARTVTFTMAGIQTSLAAITVTFNPTAEITNPGAPAVGLTVTVDATGQAQGASAGFNIVAAAASAAVTGTIQGGANAEADIVTGGGTIVVTLTGDTWVAAGGVFDGQRQNIINGIDAAGAEAAGWDAVVKTGLVVDNVVRTSDTVVTVTLPAFAGYSITANETITVTIPGTALTGAAPIVAAPTFTIINAAPPASTNANLSALTLSAGVLAPIFDVNTTAYTANVANGVASVDITATTDHGAATMTVNGVATVSGAARTVALAVGANAIPVVVTAEDGVTDKTYTVTVTRAAAAAPAPVFTPAPTQCPPGSHSASGFTPCTVAPAGSFAAGPGATSATLCAPGSFSNVAGAATCQLAPLNTFVATDGATSATACPAGTSTRSTGATSAAECVRPKQVSDVSFTANNYQAGQLAVWTVRFTTSPTGSLTAGNTITVKMPTSLIPQDPFNLRRVSGGNLAYTRVQRPGSIVVTFMAGISGYPIPASTTFEMSFVATNPAAGTIGAANLTVVTSQDTVPGAALADVVITPRPGPKLTAIAVAPSDFNPFTGSLSDIISVTPEDGRTAYTVDVPAGKRYRIHAEAERGEVTYFLGTTEVDPEVRTYAIGQTVTIRTSDPTSGVSSDYTVTLRAAAQLNGVRFSASPTTPSTATAITAAFAQSGTNLVTGNTIRLSWTDFTVTTGVTPSAVRVSGFDAGVTFTVSGASATGITLTLGGTGGLTAGTEGVIRITGYTTPAAKTIAKAGLTVRTTQVTTPVASSADIVISGAPTLTALSLVPKQTGFSRIDVPVVDGQLVYEVDVPAYDETSRVPTYELSATMSDPGAQIRISAFGNQFPPAQFSARSGESLIFTGTNSAGTSPRYTIRLRALPQLTGVRFSASPTTPTTATRITVEFTSSVALRNGDTITLGLTGFTPTLGVTASATRAIGFDSGVTFAVSGASSTGLTVRLTGTGGLTGGTRGSFTVTGYSTPAAGTIAKAGLTVSTTQVTTPVASSTDIVIRSTSVDLASLSLAPASAIEFDRDTTSYQVTVPSTATSVRVSLSPVDPLATLHYFRTSSNSLSSPSGPFANPANSNLSLLAGTTIFSFRVTSGNAEKTYTVTVTRSAALTNAAVTLSNNTPGATGVTATITFVTPVAIPGGGKIEVGLPGFTWPATPSAVFTAPAGTAAPMDAGFAGGRLTVINSAGAIPAGTVTLRVTGATNPEAAQAARTNVVIRTTTSADATIAETSNGTLVTIMAAPLSVTIQAPATVVARPAGGTFQLNTTVSGLGGATPSYAWTATPAGCSELLGVTTSSNLSVFVPDDRSIPACTFAVTVTAGSRSATASHTVSFTAPVKRLEFTSQPADGTSPYAVDITVRVLDADGEPDATFTGNVTLSARAAGRTFTIGIARVENGEARFTRTWTPQLEGATWTFVARATGYTEVSSDSFAVEAPVTATRLVITSEVPTRLTVGEKFTLTVAAQDAAGRTDTSKTGSVTLSSSRSGLLVGATPATFVNGVATFTNVSLRHTGTYSVTASATGLTSATTGNIPVTVDLTPTSIGFIQLPAHEATGVAFRTQPQVAFYNAAGQVVTSVTAPVTLTLSKVGGGTTTSTLGGTSSTAAVAGVATFSGMTVTGADSNLVLTATSGTLTVTSQPFTVHADAITAVTAQTVQSTKLTLSSSLVSNSKSDLASGFRTDICAALHLSEVNCARVKVSTDLSASITRSGAQTAVLAQTANVDPLITIGAVDMDGFAAANGAPPEGTQLLQGLLVQARDDSGLLMDALPAGMSAVLTFTVPSGQLPADTPVGDLRVVEWTGSDWRTIRSATVTANEDGSFTLTAESGELTVFGVLFAPGASAITGLTGFSASGVASGVFAGGPVDLLKRATALNDGSSAWVQRGDGAFRVLPAKGAVFLTERFVEEYGGWIFERTPLFLTRLQHEAAPTPTPESSPAPATTDPAASTVTYTVLPTDTLSQIGARFGVNWVLIAEANGIPGPNYPIRDGQVLTIPQ